MADVAVAAGSKGMEFIENPFTANGELSQKADYIITHSTITRREILIADPDCIPIPTPIPNDLPPNKVVQQEHLESFPNREERPAQPESEEEEDEEEVVTAAVVPLMEHPAVARDVPCTSIVKRDTVEAEVRKVDTAEPQHAEEVQLKKKKRCCSVL